MSFLESTSQSRLHQWHSAHPRMTGDYKRMRMLTSSDQVFNSIQFPKAENPRIQTSSELKLLHQAADKCGLVARVYLNEETQQRLIRITYQEKMIGKIETDMRLQKNVWIINDHVFVLGSDKADPTAPAAVNSAVLFEYKQNGELLRKAILKDVANPTDARWTIAWNASYIALVVNHSSKVFISDLGSQRLQTQTRTLASNVDQEVGCAIIHRNHLLVGSCDIQTGIKEFTSKITLFNLFDTEVQKTFPVEVKNCSISHIVAWGMHAYFVTHENETHVALRQLNLLDGTQKKILDLPNIENIEGNVTLAINDNSLAVCYRTSNSTLSIIQREVIDLTLNG